MIAKWIIEPGQIESDTKLTEEQWSEIEAAKNVAIVAKNVTFSNLK